MRRRNIPLDKVQDAFNAAIRRRDSRCMVRDYEPCSGKLECSHYHTVGGNPALRFYPPNAYSQCQRHHFNHHCKTDSSFYAMWMLESHKEDAEKMEALRHRFLRYTDELKAEIIRLCDNDRLDELKALIESQLEANACTMEHCHQDDDVCPCEYGIDSKACVGCPNSDDGNRMSKNT